VSERRDELKEKREILSILERVRHHLAHAMGLLKEAAEKGFEEAIYIRDSLSYAYEEVGEAVDTLRDEIEAMKVEKYLGIPRELQEELFG